MHIKEKMKMFKEDFNIHFEKEIKSILQEQQNFHSVTTELDIPLRDFILNYTRGGKRIRPFLIDFFSTTPNEKTFQLGIAIELFHLAALIHDDMMDESTLRRGVPTIHIATNSYTKQNSHLGTDIALLLGDIFLTASIAKAASLPTELFQEFYSMIQRTIRGQYLDSFGMNHMLGETPRGEIMARHKLKTAWYTFCSPCRLGIMSQEKYNKQELQIASQISTELGLLFQIRDDIIDCIDENSGKALFGDIMENQTTWVTIHIKENYPQKFIEIVAAKKIASHVKIKEIFKDIDLITPYQIEFDKCEKLIQDMDSQFPSLQKKALDVLDLLKIS